MTTKLTFNFQPYTVAVMVPIRNALEKLASELGKTYSDYNVLCKDNDIIQVGLMSGLSGDYIDCINFHSRLLSKA